MVGSQKDENEENILMESSESEFEQMRNLKISWSLFLFVSGRIEM